MKPKDKEPRFVECGTPFFADDEDEITTARSIVDEIIEETESEDFGKDTEEKK